MKVAIFQSFDLINIKIADPQIYVGHKRCTWKTLPSALTFLVERPTAELWNFCLLLHPNLHNHEIRLQYPFSRGIKGSLGNGCDRPYTHREGCQYDAFDSKPENGP